MSDRAEGYEGCPGCIAVKSGDKPCAPGNLSYCTAVQGNTPEWSPGSCIGCSLLVDEEPCQSGNAKVCPVAWLRNR